VKALYRALLLGTLLLGTLVLASCQTSRPQLVIPDGANPSKWRADIDAFLAQDLEHPSPRGCVVFVGSSSIRMWQTLAADMAPIPIVHRGFGGSRLFDASYYSDELISKHQPSVVVVFSGTNDIAGEQPKSAEQVRDLFLQLVQRMRWHDPNLMICNIAITPTLAREKHIPIVKEANRLIRLACEADAKLEFVDPSPDLLDSNGRPDAQWFRTDRLHLNERGYAIWTHHIRPVVQRLYNKHASDH
jgi:lysophospholipase L1-like esterase